MCCLILAAGCAKEEETGPDTGLAADDHFYVVVDLPQPQTRASMGAANDEEYEFAWDDADEFGAVVYDGSEYTLHKFTQKSGKDNIFGTDTFVPEKDASYTWYLLYPYDESFMVNGDLSSSPVVNVPAQIAGCEPDALTHLAVPFYSKVETEGFDSFYAVVQNPLAVLNISISNMTGEELLLSEIQVSGGMSGDFVLDFSTGALTSQAQAAFGFTISLENEDISDDETQSYYLTCAPVAVTSPIEVKVVTDKGEFSSIAEYEEAMERGDERRLEDLLVRMDALKAWDYEQRAKQILGQLKIHHFEQRIGELSGGQLKRVALANVLITDPELIILDEPTNHLDLEMTEWLEGYLSRANISLLMVTHDRYFLDRVCNEILEIDRKQIYSYK